MMILCGAAVVNYTARTRGANCAQGGVNTDLHMRKRKSHIFIISKRLSIDQCIDYIGSNEKLQWLLLQRVYHCFSVGDPLN